MTREQQTKHPRLTWLWAPVGIVALTLIGTTAAEATCVQKVPQLRAVHPAVPLLQHGGGADQSAGDESIVGLWHIDFAMEDGTPYDEAFEMWHADGTEFTLDNAVSPSSGNVCIGVWKQIGPRTVKLTHVGWNRNADGTVAGTFWLWMTATVDRNGRSFTGTFSTDSYDVSGSVVPALHASGTVKGRRITVD